MSEFELRTSPSTPELADIKDAWLLCRLDLGSPFSWMVWAPIPQSRIISVNFQTCSSNHVGAIAFWKKHQDDPPLNCHIGSWIGKKSQFLKALVSVIISVKFETCNWNFVVALAFWRKSKMTAWSYYLGSAKFVKAFVSVIVCVKSETCNSNPVGASA